MESTYSEPEVQSSDIYKPDKHVITPVEKQKQLLDKLMSNVDKPVYIPEPKKPHLKPPPEFVKSYAGSSAGAGSGEFHVYRNLRRKEMTRQELIQEEIIQDQKKKKFDERMEAANKIEEAKREKRRLKRMKRKGNVAMKPDLNSNEASNNSNNTDIDSHINISTDSSNILDQGLSASKNRSQRILKKNLVNPNINQPDNKSDSNIPAHDSLNTNDDANDAPSRELLGSALETTSQKTKQAFSNPPLSKKLDPSKFTRIIDNDDF